MCPRALGLASALALLLLAASAALADDEKPIPESEVPKAAVDAVHKKYEGAKVAAWIREEEDKRVTLEAKVRIAVKDKDGKESVRKVDVTLSEDGKILEEEETIAESEIPEAVRKAIAAGPHAKARITRVERKTLAEKADVATYEIVFTENGKSTGEIEYDATGKVLEDGTPEHCEHDEKDDGGMDGDDHGGMGGDDHGGMGGGGHGGMH